MKKYLQEGLDILGLELEEKKVDQIIDYIQFLLEYNKHTNLTAIREEKAVIEKHVLDTMLLEEFIPAGATTAIDIGTGAGFPGMILAICHPEIHFTLMDSVGKKIIFLGEVVERLGLTNVELVNERAEEFIKKGKREFYDLGFCRGVSKLAVILEYMIPFLKVDGLFLPQKMVGTEEEAQSLHAREVLSTVLEGEELRHLPYSKEERLILKLRKTEKTAAKYPRKTGMATKRPL